MSIQSGDDVYYVYVLGNKDRSRLRVHTTGDLSSKLSEIQYDKVYKKKSNGRDVCDILLYWEQHGTALEALKREREISSWSRRRMEDLIYAVNGEWKALNEEVIN